jgi:hypothetical protein
MRKVLAGTGAGRRRQDPGALALLQQGCQLPSDSLRRPEADSQALAFPLHPLQPPELAQGGVEPVESLVPLAREPLHDGVETFPA